MDPLLKQASLKAISYLSNSALGSEAGPLADAALVEVLGLGSSDTTGAYLAKIDAALSAIKEKLDGLQHSLSVVLDCLIEIEEKIDDANAQMMLARYADNAIRIRTYFAMYANLVKAVAAADDGARAKAAGDLYAFLSAQQTRVEVIEALARINDVFAPGVAEQQGLASFQATIVSDAIMAESAHVEDHWAGTPDERWLHLPFTNASGAHGIYQMQDFFGSMQNAARAAIDGKVLGALKSYLTIAIQGLVLANALLLGTRDENLLATALADIDRVRTAWTTLGTALPGAIDAEAAKLLEMKGKRALCADDARWSRDHGMSSSTDRPYDGNWMQWGRAQFEGMGWVMFQPWDYDGSYRREFLFPATDADNNRCTCINWWPGPALPDPAMPNRYDPRRAESKFYLALAALTPG